jgi:hypothetical protein
MLQKIHQPRLIVHGNKDVVVMPINALLLVQHADMFLKHVQLFFQGSGA